jgi:flavin reductase (DIM6/NTAB) family NADH-FMN oxidoreductase RutF
MQKYNSNDISEFRKTVSLFSTGITIVRAQSDKLYTGLTANSFTSVSLEPLLILVCLKNKAQTLEVIRDSQEFKVDILSDKQSKLAWLFSKSDRQQKAEYLKGCPYDKPLLSSLVSLECSLKHDYSGGDHRILVGQVESFYRDADENLKPAIYFNSNILPL